MLSLIWPWLWAAIPLPWLVLRWVPGRVEGSAVMRVPRLESLPTAGHSGVLAGRSRMSVPGLLGWTLLVFACARPVWQGEPIEQAVSGRDLMLAVDLSGSMEIGDFVLKGSKVDRLTATKAVAGEFIERRVGDRVGLVLFGERAYLQAPLTFDRKTVRTLLDESVIGLAGDKTAIGDAIGLAVKRLKENPKDQRVLILLSDGANTAGTVAPLQAAELAAKEGLKVYTIGIGADEMVIRDLLGSRKVNPSQDLDEPTMRGIAEKTGGRYFRARDVKELENIYQLLDELEPVERDKRYYRPQIELYPWPLGAALLLAAFLVIYRERSVA
ncbi:MAG: VWA domain-containing protein [Methylococcaceae bacterium]|nr:VWA domain-containing protein [Methylococcaceae bacterium]